MNTTLTTFDQLAVELSKPTKKNYFGSDARFEYTRQVKKKIEEKRPSPVNYLTTI
jgi:phosphopantetheine adenylyltransferase